MIGEDNARFARGMAVLLFLALNTRLRIALVMMNLPVCNGQYEHLVYVEVLPWEKLLPFGAHPSA